MFVNYKRETHALVQFSLSNRKRYLEPSAQMFYYNLFIRR